MERRTDEANTIGAFLLFVVVNSPKNKEGNETEEEERGRKQRERREGRRNKARNEERKKEILL
jgi:hypothetical protein